MSPYCLDCKGHNVVTYTDEVYAEDDVIIDVEDGD